MGIALCVSIAMEALHIAFALCSNLNYNIFAKRVDHACANAMQSAGKAICVVIKFSAGMELSIHDLDPAHAELFMYADRYAAAVIFNSNRIILV